MSCKTLVPRKGSFETLEFYIGKSTAVQAVFQQIDLILDGTKNVKTFKAIKKYFNDQGP